MKRLTKAALLACAAAALVGGYLLLDRSNAPEADVERQGSFPLVKKEAKDAASLSWDADGESFRYARGDGGWYDADDPDIPADQSALDAIAEEAAALTARRRIEAVKDEKVYGIGPDSFRAALTWSDGSETVLSQGSSTPFDDGTYAATSDDPGAVYILDGDISGVFGATRAMLTAKEEIPVPEDVTRLRVAGALDIVRDADRPSLDPDRAWYDAATGAPLVTGSAQNAVDTAKALGWTDTVKALAAPGDGGEYGFGEGEKRIEMEGADGKSCVIVLGSESEGGGRYAKLPDSRLVHTLDGQSVERLLALRASDMADARLVPAPEANVREMAFDAGALSRKISYGEAEGGELRAAIDGEECAPGAADAVRDRLLALTVSSFAGGEARGEALLRVTVTDDKGLSFEYGFFDLSADEYLCACSDGTRVRVSADGVDALLRALRNL